MKEVSRNADMPDLRKMATQGIRRDGATAFRNLRARPALDLHEPESHMPAASSGGCGRDRKAAGMATNVERVKR